MKYFLIIDELYYVYVYFLWMLFFHFVLLYMLVEMLKFTTQQIDL
jgi:hypothetical protein